MIKFCIVFGILAKCVMHVLSCNQAFKNPIKFANYFDRGRIFFFKLILEYAFERCLLKF